MKDLNITQTVNPNDTKHERNCGECLFERIEIIQLVNGICPKCGADYRETK